jgi:hypothetical protein
VPRQKANGRFYFSDSIEKTMVARKPCGLMNSNCLTKSKAAVLLQDTAASVAVIEGITRRIP